MKRQYEKDQPLQLTEGKAVLTQTSVLGAQFVVKMPAKTGKLSLTGWEERHH